MPFSRARYVTLCQQSLVTATVLVVGLSAAGIKTLDIVAPSPTDAQGVPSSAPEPTTGEPGLAIGRKPAREPSTAQVDTAPVTPKVREVKIAPRASARSNDQAGTGSSSPSGSPSGTPSATASPSPKSPPSRAERRTPETEVVGGKTVVAQSDPQDVSGYATVGVTWKHGVQYAETQVAFQVRTRTHGRWSQWTKVDYHDEHGPDGDAGELKPGARPGTDALVIGDVDKVQMRAESASGDEIPELQLAVIDPGTGTTAKERPAIDTGKLADSSKAGAEKASDAAYETEARGDTATLSAMKVAPKPTIYSRAQWGANEKLRDPGLPNYGTVKAGFIHHTVNANTYTADQVPALLRGIYAYHTQSRGWRDIGYNFLVDRFGRIWEGRFGGVDKAVVGAHTQGYNEVSFAMSAIGNFDIAQPPSAVLYSFAKLFAWKLSLYNIRADATRVYLKNRYVNAINGHRDVGQTACPGRYLYAKIPTIRTLAQQYQNAAQTGTTVPTPAPTDPNAMTSPTQAPLAAETQPATTSTPRSLNLAGDAAPDLVLKRSDGTVSVLPTGGQVGFRTPVTSGANWQSYTMVVGIGDVTGDGRGDVLVRSRNGVSGVYAGDGVGHVRGKALGLTTRFRNANLVMPAGYWNKDRKADVIMRDARTGYLWLVKGAGGGRFGGAKLLSKSYRNFLSVTVTGDLTGDGRPDVVGLHRNHYLYLAAAKKKGKLGTLVRRGRLSSSITQILGGTRDLTGDSYGDLVIRSTSGSVAVLPGRRYAWFGRALGTFPNVNGLGRLSLAPMTAGSAPDIVGVRNGSLAIASQNGLRNLGSVLPSNLKRTDIVQLLNVGDWNGDGRGDVITRQSAGDSLVLRPGLGKGTLGAGVLMSYGWRTFTRLAPVGDVNGDGRPDLMGRTDSGSTLIFRGNGSTGFLRPITAGNYLKTFNQVGVGLWKPQQFSSSSYLGANGSFVPYRGTGVGSIPGYNWVLGPGDVDGDGRADLVTRDSAGTLWLLPGTESGYAARRLIGEGFAGYTLGG